MRNGVIYVVGAPPGTWYTWETKMKRSPPSRFSHSPMSTVFTPSPSSFLWDRAFQGLSRQLSLPFVDQPIPFLSSRGTLCSESGTCSSGYKQAESSLPDLAFHLSRIAQNLIFWVFTFFRSEWVLDSSTLSQSVRHIFLSVVKPYSMHE